MKMKKFMSDVKTLEKLSRDGYAVEVPQVDEEKKVLFDGLRNELQYHDYHIRALSFALDIVKQFPSEGEIRNELKKIKDSRAKVAREYEEMEA